MPAFSALVRHPHALWLLLLSLGAAAVLAAFIAVVWDLQQRGQAARAEVRVGTDSSARSLLTADRRPLEGVRVAAATL